MSSTVLIVDDHPGFLEAAELLLEAEGFKVVGRAEDGAAALAAAADLRPDVVLLDIQLPVADGIAVAYRLAELRVAPAVVLTSSREASDYGARLEEAPVRGFISKSQLSGSKIAELLARGS